MNGYFNNWSNWHRIMKMCKDPGGLSPKEYGELLEKRGKRKRKGKKHGK